MTRGICEFVIQGKVASTSYVQDYIVVPTTNVYIGIVICKYIDFSAVSTSMGEKKNIFSWRTTDRPYM